MDATIEATKPITKENLGELAPPLDDWPEFQKTVPTKALRVDGSFAVRTREGVLSCDDGYLLIDSHGFPQAIGADEFQAVYEPV